MAKKEHDKKKNDESEDVKHHSGADQVILSEQKKDTKKKGTKHSKKLSLTNRYRAYCHDCDKYLKKGSEDWYTEDVATNMKIQHKADNEGHTVVLETEYTIP